MCFYLCELTNSYMLRDLLKARNANKLFSVTLGVEAPSSLSMFIME